VTTQEGTLNKPTSIDPVEWAEYNARQDHTLAALSGLPAPEPRAVGTDPRAIPSASDEVDALEVTVDATACLRELLGAVRGAAAELQSSNYAVAAELYTALARFSKQTGVKP
jgi:hypothetical protein